MVNARNKLTTTLLGAALTAALSLPAQAGTLENLERERALAIETMLDPDITAEERQKKIAGAKRRLVDLERMVIRDKSLKGKNTPVVRVAFKNYDLTFLMHASVEKQVTLADQWLEQVGITTSRLMSARVGRR